MKTILVIVDRKEGPVLKEVEEISLRSLGNPVHFLDKNLTVDFLRQAEPSKLGIFPYFRWCSTELLHVIESCISAGSICLNDPRSVNQLGDKMGVMRLVSAAAISIPNTLPILREEDYEEAGNIIGLPIVVKGYPSGGGSFVSLHRKHAEAFETVKQLFSRGLNVLVQKYIATSTQRDVRVQICNGKVSHSIQKQASGDEWRANICLGGSYKPFDLTRKQKDVAERVAAELKMNFVGLDFLFGHKDLLFNEANAAFAWYMFPDVAEEIGKVFRA